jgi:hypothetical protein
LVSSDAGASETGVAGTTIRSSSILASELFAGVSRNFPNLDAKETTSPFMAPIGLISIKEF